MRRLALLALPAVIAAGCGVVVAGLLAVAGCGGSTHQIGAKETAFNFVHAVKAYNYGTACSYYSPEVLKQLGGIDSCASSFVVITFLGSSEQGSPYYNAHVVVGSYKELANGDVQIRFAFGDRPGGTATLHKYPSGWRITKVA